MIRGYFVLQFVSNNYVVNKAVAFAHADNLFAASQYVSRAVRIKTNSSGMPATTRLRAERKFSPEEIQKHREFCVYFARYEMREFIFPPSSLCSARYPPLSADDTYISDMDHS